MYKMDSQSSPSLSLATADDGVVDSEAAGLAKEAALLFHSGKYADCLRVLNHLLIKKRDDPKVRHNIAIAETFQDGSFDPKRVVEALENIKKQSEELTHAAGDNKEAPSSEEMVGLSGSNCAVNQFAEPSIVYSANFDSSVTTFNLALIWFYLHEYENSYLYLDTLFQNIEPIDEGTALRVCLLLLDVSLRCHHASKFSDVISYVEKVFCLNSLSKQVDNGTSAQQSSSLPKSVSLSSNPDHPDFQSDSVNANNLENSLARTLSEEALEDEPLQLLSSLNISGKKLQRAGITSSNDLHRSHEDESLSGTVIKLYMHLYRVRFFILVRNLKAAKREVKLAMNLARGKDYPLALYLKSQLEYARANHQKAIKLLMASANLTETGISSMYYNNLGCIYYRLGKHHTAGIFFAKALKNVLLIRKENPPKFLTSSQDKSLLMSYNCGIHSLACGRPIQAARCFQKASLVFYNRPLLWLRIAECCLMALEKGIITSSHASDLDKSGVRLNVIGRGKWRQLALQSQDKQSENDLFPHADKQPVLSLSLARQCLINALFLLNSDEKHHAAGSIPSFTEGESQSATHDKNAGDFGLGSSQIGNTNGEVKEQKSGNSPLQSFVSVYECVLKTENQMIIQATLADLAYVELALGNPVAALSTAKSLLKVQDCSKAFLFLGTMYAAEALCLLNQPNEAAQHLMTYVSSGNNNVELPYRRGDLEKETKVADINEESTPAYVNAFAFTSPEEARGIFCANYAANFALLGDLKQAEYFVKMALSDIPGSSQAIVTWIYVDLKSGKIQDALAKLKQHSAVRFVSSSSS